MIFYKVNPKSDQTSFNNSILIANELWTLKELQRAKAKSGFIKEHFTPVAINKFKTCWFFGARFSIQTKFSLINNYLA